ncbi:hypothetical protein WJX77_001221 [Trebouxia sp. C0004]
MYTSGNRFLLVYQTLVCKATRNGCGHVFSNLDAAYRSPLSLEQQSQFPIATLHKDGYTGRLVPPCMVSLVQNWIGNRSSAEQLAKVYEQQEQAKYLRHRKVYTEVQTAKQQGSVGQPSMEAYLENPSQRLADPFPSYSSIHPDHMNNDHMNNEVPSYCGFHASGKWIVSIIQAVALIHKKYDVLHMQSQSARVLSNDVCPALAGASKDQSTKTVAVLGQTRFLH